MKNFKFIFLFFLSNSYIQAQNIKVYFNQSVDNTVSSITDAQTSLNLDDTICALINAANITVDVAVWDNGSSKIVIALNNAYSRGVQVRYISATNSINSALSGLNSNISLLKRNGSLNSNVMHNKFIIIDNLKLLTGSMNFGTGSMFDDYNNIVIISDIGLAQNYTTEFNEMWGSTSALPNISNSKFGPNKTDNTIHNFTVSGTNIESYFSPTDNTTSQIVNAINTADYTLDIAMFTFINNDLGDAVVAAKNRGVNVRCIIENVNYFGSEYNSLINNGINVLSHNNVPYDFHHKYCIIDAANAGSDPTVVMGSHNWTNSAENDYDENTLIIHNSVVANQYWEEFSKRFAELGPSGIDETTGVYNYKFYPNPFSTTTTLQTDNLFKNATLTVYNLYGQTVKEIKNISELTVTLFRDNLPSGLYFIRLTEGNKIITADKLVITD